MKNAFSILALMMTCSARLSAASDWVVPALNLTFHNTVPNKGVASQYPRVPARFPIIGQEGHTFTFEYPGCFSSVELVEEGSGETVVYEMAVDEKTSEPMESLDSQKHSQFCSRMRNAQVHALNICQSRRHYAEGKC